MPKAAALTSSLLARKGEAMPAMVSASFNDPSLAWEDTETNGTMPSMMGAGAVADRPVHVTSPRPVSALLTPVGRGVPHRPDAKSTPKPAEPIRFRRIKADNIPATMIPCFSIPVLVAPPVQMMDEVVRQPAPTKGAAPKAARKPRVRVSLRMPEGEYMRLKMLAVTSRRSMQEILFEALTDVVLDDDGGKA